MINNNNSMATGGDGGGDWPKASIGNYKGVMLCNRPNEFGQQRKADRAGLEPFNSRVTPAEPIGWNPTVKLLPKVSRKRSKSLSALTFARGPQQHPRAPPQFFEATRRHEDPGTRSRDAARTPQRAEGEDFQGAGRQAARQNQSA